MAGLDPAIHVFRAASARPAVMPRQMSNQSTSGTTWMAGSSPAMTACILAAGAATPPRSC